MTNPLISVVIPVYNEETDIDDCLTSLRLQTYTPLETIVVDDGSTDQTRDIVRKYPVKLVKAEHLGPGPARNTGAKQATGEILVFVDADMTFEPDFIDMLTLPIRKNQYYGTFSKDEFVSNWDNPYSQFWNFNNGNFGKKRVRDDPEDHEDYRAILASEFKRVAGFDPIGYTDSRSLVAKLGRPRAAPNAVYYHKNPATLQEVFRQSRWIGRRKTKWGIGGQLVNLVRYSLPFSILNGLRVSATHRKPAFIPFKIIYDLGFSLGTLSNLIIRQTAK